MNNRRRLVVAYGASALMAPLVSHAQQAARIPRIAYLGNTSLAGNAARVEALRRGLREFGYVEGKNIAIELRSADGDMGRLPALITELIQLKVDIIVSGGPIVTRAAKAPLPPSPSSWAMIPIL